MSKPAKKEASKNSAETYGAEGRTNLLTFLPDTLTLVEDANHPLYDPRVHEPLSETVVLSIMASGVRVPITVWKDPETGLACVVDGRQRVKNAVEANRRLKKAGQPPKLVPGVALRGDAKAAMAVMALANEGRLEPTPLGRAKMAQRLIDAGYTDEQVATLLCVSTKSLQNYLSLAIGATKALRDAVEKKGLSPTLAYDLAKLPPDEQKEKVAMAVKELGNAPAKGDGVRKKRKKVRAAAGITRMRSRKALLDEIELLKTERGLRIVADLLRWAMGEDLDPDKIRRRLRGAMQTYDEREEEREADRHNPVYDVEPTIEEEDGVEVEVQ